MNPEIIHYDLDHLQSLLDETLPATLTKEVSEHLADCAECRNQLESLAGVTEWWTQVSEGAKTIFGHPSDYQSSIGEHPPLANSASFGLNDETFASDFAVDFLAPSDDPAMLGRLGNYEILGVIGRGGMGIVFKGFQKELHRFVAIKVLAPQLALSPAARRRFEREAQATAAVVHPHVMAIHSVAADARLPYLVMPFVDCESLQQRLDRQGPLDVKDVLRIGMQAANGLAAAHAQGLVHRDVKPANILLEANVDRVMLTDFGLARAVDDATLTRTGIIAGTPQYMSPEQANGDAVNHRSDLFSLGSVVYAMCTARPPFRAETTFGVLRRIREETPRSLREINSDIPDWLEQIVLKLLSKSPEDRMVSATDVAELFAKCLTHVQQPTSVPLPPEISAWQSKPLSENVAMKASNPKTWLRMRWTIAGFVLAASMALTTFWWASLSTLSTPHATPLERQELKTNLGEASEPALPLLLQWNQLQQELDSANLTIDNLEDAARRDLEPPNHQTTEASRSTEQ